MPTTEIIQEFNFGIYAIATRTDESAIELDDLSAEEARTLLDLFTPGFVGHEDAFAVKHSSGMNLEIGSGNAKSDLYIVPSTQVGQGNYLVRLNPSVVPVVVPAADPSSNRTDQIYLIVTDGNYEGGNLYLPRLAYRRGDAEQGLPGPDSIWNSYALLSSIPVPAGSSSPGTLTDDRKRAGVVESIGGTIPIGGIIMWSGSIANIPVGWRLCDGGGGTPNLRNRFVVGAGTTYNPGNTGGANTVTLTTAQMPSHNHSGPSHTHSGPSHTHARGTIATGNAGGHTHRLSIVRLDATVTHRHGSSSRASAQVSGQEQAYISTTSVNGAGALSGGSHNHSVSGSTASGGTGNTGSSGTGNTGSTGSGNAHENRPPYYALAFIQRVQ